MQSQYRQITSLSSVLLQHEGATVMAGAEVLSNLISLSSVTFALGGQHAEKNKLSPTVCRTPQKPLPNSDSREPSHGEVSEVSSIQWDSVHSSLPAIHQRQGPDLHHPDPSLVQCQTQNQRLWGWWGSVRKCWWLYFLGFTKRDL